jgi:hypothetical protein
MDRHAFRACGIHDTPATQTRMPSHPAFTWPGAKSLEAHMHTADQQSAARNSASHLANTLRYELTNKIFDRIAANLSPLSFAFLLVV